VLGLIFGLAARFGIGVRSGLEIALAGAIASGAGSGLMNGLTQALSISMPADKLITPIDSYQGNHRLVLAIEAGVGVAVGVATGVAFGVASGVGIGPAAGVVIGISSGIGIGAVAGLAAGATNVNYYLPAHLAFALMRRAGCGPANMMDFLEDARRRGVLRTAGSVYQFRHARLQDLLATTHQEHP
jgi:hypothetical protein